MHITHHAVIAREEIAREEIAREHTVLRTILRKTTRRDEMVTSPVMVPVCLAGRL